MALSRWHAVMVAFAGLLGAAGVSLAAMAAHVDDSVALRAAAELAMVHAAAGLGLIAVAQRARWAILWAGLAAALLLGAGLFTASVSMGVLIDFRPLPMLAPIGGSLTILAWLAVAGVGVLEAFSGESRPGG